MFDFAIDRIALVTPGLSSTRGSLKEGTTNVARDEVACQTKWGLSPV